MIKTRKFISIFLSVFMLLGMINATSVSVYAAQKPTRVSLSTKTYTYDGKAKKPKVVAKDSKNKTIATKYYTVKYPSGRKNVGTYTVNVKFKGKYKGSKSLKFKIVPKGTSISSVSAGVKSFNVKYKKQSTQTTGYQVQFADNSLFKSATTKTISKNLTTSYKVNARGNMKYYVRVRTYKKSGKTNYYSSWSKAKSVITKTALSFKQNKYTIYNGQYKKFTFSGDAKLTWSTSNPKVATVDQNGKVCAVGKGTCKITVKSPNDVNFITIVVPGMFYENDNIPDLGAIFGVIPVVYVNRNDVVTRFYDLDAIEANDKNWKKTYVSELELNGFYYDGERHDEENDIIYHMYYNSLSYVDYDNVMYGVWTYEEDGSRFLVVAYINGNGKNIETDLNLGRSRKQKFQMSTLEQSLLKKLEK